MTLRPPRRLLRLFFAFTVCVIALGIFLLESPSQEVAFSGSGREGVIEQARYVFGWNGLTAAVAEFTLTRRTEGDHPTLHFLGRARTIEGIDLLWRMRDSVEALVDGRTLGPRRFQLFRRENKKRVDLDVVHDLEENKFRISRLKGGRLRKGTVPASGVYDPVSAMLVLRQKSWQKGAVETIRVLEGKRVYKLTLERLAKERVLVDGENIPAIKLAITYQSDDGRRSSKADGIGSTYLWVGDEPAHPLLRLEAEAFAGIISGERVRQSGAGFPPMGDS